MLDAGYQIPDTGYRKFGVPSELKFGVEESIRSIDVR
jgi:hypothetical protein